MQVRFDLFGQAFVSSVRDFFKNHGMLYSASLSFYALLSFIPLVFLLVSIAGRIVGKFANLHTIISDKFATLPWFRELLLERLDKFMDIAPEIGWLSLIVVFWTSGVFFMALSTSFRSIWPSRKTSLPRRLTIPWIAGPFLSIVFSAFILAGHLVNYIPISWLQQGTTHPLFLTLTGLILFIFLFYMALLPKECRFLPTLITAFFIALAIQVVTTLFTSLIWFFPRYKLIYGTLSSTVLFLLWVEYDMALILWGVNFLKKWTQVNENNQHS